MLAAEKQVLDATLRNNLQDLRRMELKMVVNRFQTVIPASTLIVGFTFTAVVELDFLDTHDPTTTQTNAERLFYIFCAMSLSGSLYSMTVSSIAIILGQRLAVQATANLSARHEQNVKELINKFNLVLILLLASLCGVVLASISAIWVKSSGNLKHFPGIYKNPAMISTSFVLVVFPFIVYSMISMWLRLFECEDEAGVLSLVAEGSNRKIGEFRVGDQYIVDVESGKAIKTAADERSSLLKCAQGPQQKEHTERKGCFDP